MPQDHNSPPTQDEVASCEEYSQIVAVGGIYTNSKIYLRLTFGTGETEIVWLEESGARHLGAVLKALVPQFETIGGLSVFVDTATGAVSAHSP
jgi:2-keto-3-deoxy-6-phosphogluconate aldolase